MPPQTMTGGAGAAGAEVAPAPDDAADGVRVPAGPPLCVVLLWAVFFNLIGYFTWGYGPLTFALMIAAAVFVALAPRLSVFLDRIPAVAGISRRTAVGVLALGVAGYLLLHGVALVQQVQEERNKIFLVDIGANTWQAADWFFASPPRNPYAHRSQLWHPITPDLPGAEVTGGRTFLYGVPYNYGYPYFPVMFMSYQPFRLLVDNYNAIRVGNAAIFLLSLGAVAWAAMRLAPASVDASGRRLCGLVAAFAFVCPHLWSREIFHIGITDLVIAFYAVLSLVALSYGRSFFGGLLLGLAWGCKLLPAPFFFVILAVRQWRAEGRRSALAFSGGFAGAAAASILPFLIADPPAFVSATVLYYLVNHAEGDDSSLYYFLPEVAQGPFLAVGLTLVAATFGAYFLRPGDSLARAARYCFLSYLLFIAFAKMIHLNYVWGMFALGAVAIAVEPVEALTAARLKRANRRRRPRGAEGLEAGEVGSPAVAAGARGA